MILPLTPVNQRKDVQGSAALTPHLCHIFTCSLCEHQLGAANAAGLKLSANLSQAQILPPFSSVWSPGSGSLLQSYTQATLQRFQFWAEHGLSLDLQPFIQFISNTMGKMYFSKCIMNQTLLCFGNYF